MPRSKDEKNELNDFSGRAKAMNLLGTRKIPRLSNRTKPRVTRDFIAAAQNPFAAAHNCPK